MSLWSVGNWWGRGRTNKKGKAGQKFARRFVPARLETLEDRIVPATLPAPLVRFPGEVDPGFTNTGTAPQIAMDPLDPNRLVAVSAVSEGSPTTRPGGGSLNVYYSNDAGFTWNYHDTFFNFTDPTRELPNPAAAPYGYAQTTDISVTFDRDHNFYVLSSQHNERGSSGAFVFHKFDFGTLDFTGEYAPITLVQDQIVHRWMGEGQLFFNPTTNVNVAADTIDIPGNHDLQTGQRIIYRRTGYSFGGPGNASMAVNGVPLAISTPGLEEYEATVYAIVVDANTIQIAASQAAALAGTALNITSAGTGVAASFGTSEDSAYAPTLAIDNNLTSYTDPSTGLVQTDTLAEMISDPSRPGRFMPKAIFLAWNASHGREPIDNFFELGYVPRISMMVSGDGGANFSTEFSVTTPGDQTTISGRPQVVFTQGTPYDPATGAPRISGGLMAVVWDQWGFGVGMDVSRPDGGVAGGSVVNVQNFTAPGPFQFIDGGRTHTPTQAPAINPPFAHIPQVTTIDFPVNITDPDFVSVSDFNVSFALTEARLNEIRIELIAPDGTTVVLVNNRTNALDVDTPTSGIARNRSNMGILNGESIPTVFDDEADRRITDPSTIAPYLGRYRPERAGAFSPSLSTFYGRTASQINGTWQLRFTDFRNGGGDGVLTDLSLKFVSGLAQGFGTDRDLILGNTPDGAFFGPYPNNRNIGGAPAAGFDGVSPRLSVALDNTLGSFSPFQGRMYVAYTSGTGTDTDIGLAYTDNYNTTFPFFNGNDSIINDDLSDDFSEGIRSQFHPTVTVDQATGTVIQTWHDARWDPTNSRTAVYLTTSIDGGNTFSPEVFLNPPKTAIDALSNQTLTIEPVPTNVNAMWPQAQGEIGLVAYAGRVFPIWGGNENQGLSATGVSIRNNLYTAVVSIANGPRIVNGDMGPIVDEFNLNGLPYNNTFTNDGTRQFDGFVIRFDRPVDPGTLDPNDFRILYRSPNAGAGSPGTDLTNQILDIVPIDVGVSHGVADPGTPTTLSIGDVTVREGTTQVLLKVILSQVQTTPTSVTYNTLSNTATVGSDFLNSSGTFTIPAGLLEANITVDILGDNIVEGNENFFVNLSGAPTAILINRPSARVHIIDDEDAPYIAVGDGIALETHTGQTPIVFPVVLNAPSTRNITFRYSTIDGTANSTDYVSTTGTVTIPAGATTGLITVFIRGDHTRETNEHFFLNLDDETNASLVRSRPMGVIVNDDDLTVSVGDITVQETNGTQVANVSVFLNAASLVPVVVNWTTQAGGSNPGTAGVDYTAATGTVTIPAGSLSASFPVTILGDLNPEANDTFQVRLTLADQAAIDRNIGTVTIIDDDAVPQVSLGDAVTLEGDAGNHGVQIPVYLTFPSNDALIVSYRVTAATGPGAATVGTDFNTSTGTITIAPLTSSAVIDLSANTVIGNILPEFEERFNVNITGVSTGGAIGAKPTSVVTIADDDFQIWIDDEFVIEQNQGPNPAIPTTTTVPIYAHITVPQTEDVIITLQTVDDTAFQGPAGTGDYLPAQVTVIIPAGATTSTQPINVSIFGDSIIEPVAPATPPFTPFQNVNERFFIRPSSVTIGTTPLTPAQVTQVTQRNGIVTILEDDTGPLNFTVADATVVETNGFGTTVAIDVYVNRVTGATQSLMLYTNMNTSAAFGTAATANNPSGLTDDFEKIAPVPVSFLPGQRVSTVNVFIPADNLVEGTETFLAVLTTPPAGAEILRSPTTLVHGFGLVRIIDDDQSRVVIGNGTVVEGTGGTTVLSFPTVILYQDAVADTIFSDSVNGTAISPDDYVGGFQTHNLPGGPGGPVVTTIDVPIVADNVTEALESFLLNLSSFDFGLSPLQVTGFILDDDQLNVSISDESVSEVAGVANFTVYLNGLTSQDVIVSYTTVDDTAAAGTDYVTNTGSVVIAAGTRQANIVVPIQSDGLAAGNKQFRVQLTGAVNAGILKADGIGTIMDASLIPTITIGGGFGIEGNAGTTPATFTAIASFAIDTDINFLTDATGHPTTGTPATPDVDFVANTGQLQTIAAGTTSTTFTVDIVGDTVAEGPEEFLVVGSAWQFADPFATGIITDNEALPTLNVGDALFRELNNGQYLVQVPVYLSRPVPVQVDFSYRTIDGTATAGQDYLPTVSNFTMLAGNTLTFLEFQINADTNKELPSEFFTVQLFDSINATIAKNNGRVEIIDDDGSLGATTFLVRIAPQSAVGTYSYSVGPFVRDRIRTALPTSDPSTGSAQTFTLSTPNVIIGGNAVAVSGIDVLGFASDQVVRDVTVTFNIQHPIANDLTVELVAPDGITSVLLVDAGVFLDDGSNFLNTTFDSESGQPIGSIVLPSTGSFRPLESLDAFKGFNPNGTWTLRVTDSFTNPPGSGRLLNWTLKVQTGSVQLGGSEGNWMDQNSNAIQSDLVRTPPDIFGIPTPINGIPFELPYDSNSLPLIIPGPHPLSRTYRVSSQANVPIPASGFGQTGTLNDIAKSSIDISGIPIGEYIKDVNVTINATYPAHNHLKMTLISPDGERVVLLNRPASLGADFNNVTFDDQSANTLGFPANDTVRPLFPLNVFAGRDGNGTWTLEIEDLVFPGNGTLLQWTLTIETERLERNGTIGSVDIAFDRDILVSSFEADNILSFIGPDGAVAGPYTVQPIPLGATQTKHFRIGFPTQSLSGYYTINFGPDSANNYITDIFNNKVDTNYNAGLDVLRGGDPNTAAIVTKQYDSGILSGTNIAPAVVFPIPGPSIQTFTLNVTDAYLIQGLAVQLNIAIGDSKLLSATLTGPDGTVVRLFDTPGAPAANPANMSNTILDDSVVSNLTYTSIENGTAPFNLGPYAPLDPLSRFINRSTLGTWTLTITNTGSGGALTNWKLLVKQANSGTGLGERGADNFSVNFRVFTLEPAAAQSYSQWVPVGPIAENAINSAAAGPVPVLAVDPSDASGNTVYSGTSNGGVWKTTNFLTQDPLGPTWIPLTDLGPLSIFAGTTGSGLNIGSIAVYPRNQDPNQSIVFVGTGGYGGTGAGFLRSMDGGRTWRVLDSLENRAVTTGPGAADTSDANVSTIASRVGHVFVNHTISKIVIDPRPAPNGFDAVLYAAVSGGSGGIYRSINSGLTWTLIRAGQATDVVLAPTSQGGNNNNLQILYAGFTGAGGGVYFSSSATTASSLVRLDGGQQVNYRRSDVGPIAVPVTAPPNTPTTLAAASTTIRVAVPSATNDPLKNTLYQGFVYAIAGGGFFVSKDFGANWTRVRIPISAAGVPTNNETRPDVGTFSDLAIDPNNPNIVYLTLDATNVFLNRGGLIRVDLTFLSDPYSLVAFDNSENDTGLPQANTTGSVTVPAGTTVYGYVNAAGDTKSPYINFLRDPENPFLSQTSIQMDNITRFNNDGGDVSWSFNDAAYNLPIGRVFTNLPTYFQVVPSRDQITGKTRLLLGGATGVFTAVDDGDGGLFTNIGQYSVANGSRTGNLQITHMYSGAVQPSALSADLAAALFYGMGVLGSLQSSEDVVTLGTLGTDAVAGTGAWVATDPSGSGQVYRFIFPSQTFPLFETDFFQRFEPGVAQGISKTNGLVQGGDNPVNPITGFFSGQWPYNQGVFGYNPIPLSSSFTVNPIDPTGLLIGSTAGRLFRSAGPLTGKGEQWFPIMEPNLFPGANVLISATAFGAQDQSQPGVLNDFIYAGNISGQVFATFTGGGAVASWQNLTRNLPALEGGVSTPIMRIIPNTEVNSKDVYVATQRGIYWLSDATSATSTWIKLNDVAGKDTLLGKTTEIFEAAGEVGPAFRSISSLAIDFRFAVPVDPSQPVSPTNPRRPVLYVGGDGGVFRSYDFGNTWSFFPGDQNVATGGLPHVRVTDLDLALGEIEPGTGFLKESGGFNMLLATTYGRGQFAIRLDNTPFEIYTVVPPVPGPQVLSVEPEAPFGIKIKFNGPVDLASFTDADIISLIDPLGNPVPGPFVITDISAPAAGQPNPHDTFLIRLPQGSPPGIYTITFGPAISDFSGHLLDQDADGITLENPDDIITASVFIQPFANHAPVLGASVLTPNDPTLYTLPEGTGVNAGVDLQAWFTGLPVDAITDADDPQYAPANAPRGIAIIGLDANGIWEFSVNNGVSWSAIGPVSNANARLLALDGVTRIRFIPNVGYSGTAQFQFRAWDRVNGASGVIGDASLNGFDSSFSAEVANGLVPVVAVNDAPSFVKGPDQNLGQGAPAQTIVGWATSISAGPPNESGQILNFLVTTSNNSLFSVLPAINATTGTLTYSPTPTAEGTVTVTVRLMDNGGTANGGVDTSAPQTFLINLVGINDAPSFTAGPNVSVFTNSGAQTFVNWATGISAGPNEGSQTVNFLITGNTRPGLFSVQPAVAANGTLTFTPATNQTGQSTITLVLRDNGGTAGGGVDTSAPITFVISVGSQPPVISPIANQLVPSNNPNVTLTFAISDPDHAATSLTVAATSSNAALLPNSRVTLTGTGGSRTLNIQPVVGQLGTSNISVTATDPSGIQTTLTFTFTVNGTPILGAISGPITMSHTQANSGPINLSISDPENDPLTRSATVVRHDPGAELDQIYALQFLKSYYQSPSLGNARWMFSRNDGSWYAILPDGRFARQSTTGGIGTLIATLPVAYYNNPQLIHDPDLQSLAVELDLSLGLFQFPAGFYTNHRGANEKYIGGTGNATYFLLPNGELRSFNTTIANSPVIRTLSPAFYNNPALLTDAQANASKDQIAYALDQIYGLKDPGSNFFLNYYGRGEKFLGNSASPSQPISIHPNGDVFIGATAASPGTRIATLDATFHTNPAKLFNAQLPNAAVPVVANFAGNVLTLDPAANFAGMTRVTVNVSDGLSSASQSFLFNVTNQAPVWVTSLSNQTVSHLANSLAPITLQATDADAGDTVTYNVALEGDTRPFDLDQQLGLTYLGGYYETAFGINAKWMGSAVDGFFYLLLPNGNVNRYSGNSAAPLGALVATLDPFYHANPQLVHDPVNPASPPIPAPTLVGNQLTVNLPPAHNYAGIFKVNVGASDTVANTIQSFYVKVTNTAPVLPAIADRTANSGQTVQINLNASDADGDTLTFPTVQITDLRTLAFQLDSSLGFYKPGPVNNPYFEDQWKAPLDPTGFRERWIRAASGQYYAILPNGNLHVFGDNAKPIGNLIATFDASYYNNPALLTDATAPSSQVTATVDTSILGGRLNISIPAGYTGTANLTVFVSDGIATVQRTFKLTVA